MKDLALCRDGGGTLPSRKALSASRPCNWRWRSAARLQWLGAILLAVIGFQPLGARGDCSFTTTGSVPLPDLGAGTYLGFPGGLYPNGSDTRPAGHEAAGLAEANQIKPLDASGNSDNAHGTIGFMSVGLSNTTDEFASGGSNAFRPQADADPSKDPKVTIVDGAQAGKDAASWTDPNDTAWTILAQRLHAAGVTPLQVQVVWMKLAFEYPKNYGTFPAHAQALQAALETILRTLKSRYPNVQIVYLSSRTRAYTNDDTTINPEPYAYESGFSVQWVIADQINGTGNLNFDASKGPVVAPYLSWGPYLWADGTNPRSDGFTWFCDDFQSDFTHPASGAVGKVADQLLTFFKTDPTATPWFLKQKVVTAPVVNFTATPSGGPVGTVVEFTATPSDPSTIASYSWTFDDGTFSDTQYSTKTFLAPGVYNVHATVTTITGDYVQKTLTVSVGTGTSNLLNVSARLQVGTFDHVGIGGFIVGGTGMKRVLLRAIGPSLTPLGIAGALADPYLELHDATGATIGTNDNWETTQLGGVITADQAATIRATSVAPTDSAEAAIVADLLPGAYTAVIRGVSNGTGVGLSEIYDLDQAAAAAVANLSTRGIVQVGANVLIGGFIIGGSNPSNIVVRALGPSLLGAGVGDALLDPTLDLHDSNGMLVASNDNWADTQQVEIEASGLAPTDSREAAIESSLLPGSYTATVTGKNGTIGVGLVEFYKLP